MESTPPIFVLMIDLFCYLPFCNYVLQINLKRARILVKSHVLHSTVPGYIRIISLVFLRAIITLQGSFQLAEWIYFRVHGLQQGREYISLVTVHEAKNNFRIPLREDGWHGEISFYGI